MAIISKCKIVLVDKKGVYSFLFEGLRKNKYSFSNYKTILKNTQKELINYNVFFVVLYDMKDVFELLKLNVGVIKIIVVSDNISIIKKLRSLGCIQFIDLTGRDKGHVDFRSCLRKILME